jgi:hypothetical protein
MMRMRATRELAYTSGAQARAAGRGATPGERVVA